MSEPPSRMLRPVSPSVNGKMFGMPAGGHTRSMQLRSRVEAQQPEQSQPSTSLKAWHE
jgi:hypothetical protein